MPGPAKSLNHEHENQLYGDCVANLDCHMHHGEHDCTDWMLRKEKATADYFYDLINLCDKIDPGMLDDTEGLPNKWPTWLLQLPGDGLSWVYRWASAQWSVT